MIKSVGEELAFNKRMGFWNEGKKVSVSSSLCGKYCCGRLMDWSGNVGEFLLEDYERCEFVG